MPISPLTRGDQHDDIERLALALGIDEPADLLESKAAGLIEFLFQSTQRR
jgi:hypothetical protein